MPTPLTDSEDEKRAENIRNDEEDAFVSASTNRISPPDVAAYRKQTSQVAERVLLKLRCNRDPIVGRRQVRSRRAMPWAEGHPILSRLWPHTRRYAIHSPSRVWCLPDILFVQPPRFPLSHERPSASMLIDRERHRHTWMAHHTQTGRTACHSFRRFPKVRMN